MMSNISSYSDYIDDVVYDLAGDLLHATSHMIEAGMICWETLLTDENLTDNATFPNRLLILRDLSGLKKVIPNMFFFFRH